MPLIVCPDCGKQISDLAASCPNCGRPIKGAQGLRVEDSNARGFLGKPGTLAHTMNVLVAAVLLGILALSQFISSLR